MNDRQPLMPHFYFHWVWDVIFAAACTAIIIVCAVRADWFWLAIGIALLGSIFAQARYAALRVRRGQKP